MKTCTVCGDRFLGEEVSEWRADHEPFSLNPFICPDCYDRTVLHKDLEDQLDELMKTDAGSTCEFEPGELIIYQNGDRYEIGKIKRITSNGAFVWYHEGDTAAKTTFDCMHKLINAYVIKANALGGEKNERKDKSYRQTS